MGVVGCGVAGLAAATALARRGHDVTLLDAFAAPRPLGSGLLLQPSGLAALRTLGLEAAVLDRGARIRRLEGRDTAGRRPMAMSYDLWRPGGFGLGVHRADLFEILHQAALGAGVALAPSAEVTAVESGPRPALTDRQGRTHGPFDLVVAADGSGSTLRGLIRPRARAPVYPFGALWANVRDPDGRFQGALTQRYDGARKMAGVLPIGGGQVSFFWSVPVDEMDGFLTRDLEAWRMEVSELWPEAAELTAQIRAADDFARATYRDVQAGRWDRGPVVLIGDAAHGTSPQLGQGANLALIDAVELALHVDRPQKLAGYQRRRRLQTAPYQLASRALTPLFQSRGGLGPWIRTWLFAPLAQAPGLNRIAARVLTGLFRLGPTPRTLRP